MQTNLKEAVFIVNCRSSSPLLFFSKTIVLKTDWQLAIHKDKSSGQFYLGSVTLNKTTMLRNTVQMLLAHCQEKTVRKQGCIIWETFH